MSASPVSRTVKEMEKELGAELFVRRYHQAELTDAGRALAARAGQVVEDFDGLRQVVSQAHGSSGRPLRLAGTHLAPPTLMDQFVLAAEDVASSVDVRLAMSSVLIPELLRGDVDAALVHLPLDERRLESVIVGNYPFFLAMRADDSLAGNTGIRLTDLGGRTVTMPDQTTQPVAIRHIWEVMEAAGVTSMQRLAGADAFMQASHIRRTRGVALTVDPALGGPSAVYADPAYTMVPIVDDNLRFTLGVAWRRDARRTDALLDRLLSRVEAQMVPDAE